MKRQSLKKSRKSHIWIHTIVFDDRRLKASDKLVYITLARFASNDTQSCYPSIEKICEVSTLTNRTVNKSLKRLEKYNYIEIKRNAGMVNTYILLEPEENKYNIPFKQDDAEMTPPEENTETTPPENFAGVQNDTGEGVKNDTGTPRKMTPLTSTYLTNISKDVLGKQAPPSSDGLKPNKEINTRDFFNQKVKPTFLELLKQYRQIENYAFSYDKEVTIIKRWIKYVKEKHPDWDEQKIASRLSPYIKHWFEAHEDEIPSISRVFSSNHLNEYRFWVAKHYPNQINNSL